MSWTLSLQAQQQAAGVPPRVGQVLRDYDEMCETLRGRDDWTLLNGVPISGTRVGMYIDRKFTESDAHFLMVDPDPVFGEAASELAHELQQVFLGGTTVTRVREAHGPGRAVGRELARMWAAPKLGRAIPPQAKPFAKRTVSRSPRTPIRVGFIQDLSFSMDDLSQWGAALSWVVAEATTAIRGEIAMTGFGLDAWPLLAPGEYLSQIPRLNMVGGNHMAGWSYELLDSVLPLADMDGARVLFVFSDGEFGDDQFEEYLAEAEDAGVVIVLVSPDGASGQLKFPPSTRGLVSPSGDLSEPRQMVGLARQLGEAVREAVADME